MEQSTLAQILILSDGPGRQRRVPQYLARMTDEDRAIFDRVPMCVEADYRFADARAASLATAIMRNVPGDGFVGYVGRQVQQRDRIEREALRSECLS